jgi:SET domain-containing protein 6
LQSLPIGTVDLPLFWDQVTNETDSVDGLEALGWLKGTAVERILHAAQEDGSTLIVRYICTTHSAVVDDYELFFGHYQDTISMYYHQVAAPLLLDHLDLWRGPAMSNREPSLSGFYRSFSLVSSRAFLVDAYHGLSMVPIADAFVFFFHLLISLAIPDCFFHL